MTDDMRSGISAACSKSDEVFNSPALATMRVYNRRRDGSALNREGRTGSENEKGTDISFPKEGVELEYKSNGSSPKEAIEFWKDEDTTFQELIDKKVNSIVQQGSDLCKERNLEWISCGSKSQEWCTVSSLKEEDNNVFSPYEEVGLERRDGSQIAECHKDCNVDGGEVVVELAENERKRTRLDGCKNSNENSVEKKSVMGGGLDGKMQTAGTVLSSASLASSDGERREFEDDIVGKMSNCGDYRERERAESETVKSNQSDGEVRRILKRKVEGRRDLKIQFEAKKKESDQSDGETRKKLGGSCGKKQGRPCKVQVDGEMKESDQSDGETRGVLGGSCRKKRGRPRKVQGEVEMEESGQSYGETRKRLGESCGKKRGRGRPRKVQGEVEMKQSGQSYGKTRKKLGGSSGKKRGRPRKVQEEAEMKESYQSYSETWKKLGGSSGKKRGRSCKVQEEVEMKDSEQSDGEMRENLGESCEKKQGRPCKAQDELKMKMPIPVKVNSKLEDSESSFGLSSEDKMALRLTKIRNNKGKHKRGKEGQVKCRAIQHAVRDRIVKLLIGAGWTIEYRQRNNREYCDAVYVNPKGKTHWSVTLAYRGLKESYENGNSESSRTGFKFIPIPDEELSVLKKVISKERCDKNVSRKGKKLKIKKTTDGVIGKKLHKRKLRQEKLNDVVTSHGTSLKCRLKDQKKTHAFDNSAGSSRGGPPLPARERKLLETSNQNRCALMVRSSKEGTESDNDGYVVYNGKRTVLAWMIDLGTVPINGKVQCFNLGKTRVILEGKITKDGICCDCCGKIFTVSQFQDHAGSAGWHTFQNIYLETGCSLLQCLLDSWNKQDESEQRWYHYVDVKGEDPNDDTCGLCGDGGDLICCDGCPSTFHQSCLGINKFPSGVWCCIYCSCKFCGMASGNTCQSNDNNDACESTILRICCLCERKYHHSCVHGKNVGNDDSGSESFCGKKCQELNGKLQRLLGVKHDLDEGFSWTLIQRYDVDSDRPLDDVSQKIECNSKLAVALYVMDECFLPMLDYRSGVNLIRNIIYNYGSNFKRLNYVGFVTAILEKDDEIVAAASIRIHGNQFAEMPFIGTRYTYRRQGICRRLLSGIESALCILDVEKLVIPAVSELRETWTSVFGFKPVEASLKQKLRNTSMLVFPGVDMLQKSMSSDQETLHAAEGLKSAELEEHKIMNESNNSSDRFSAAVDATVSSEVTTPDTSKKGDEQVAHESNSSLPPASLNDTSDITSENIGIPATAFASDTKSLVQLSENPDDLEKKIDTIDDTHGQVCHAFEQAGDIGKQHDAIMVSSVPPHEGIEALDSCPKQLGVPDVEIKSSMVANIKSSKLLESDPGVSQTIIALRNSMSLCGSSSDSGASKQQQAPGEGNSCGAPKLLILSKQVS